MIPLSTHQVAPLLGGRAVGDDVAFGVVGADSRTLGPGALFVALPPRPDGEPDQRDGHGFVDAALAGGVAAVLVSDPRAVPDGVAAIVVGDPWAALARLGGIVRERVDPRVVALTGSVGKTTTKDLVAAACRPVRRTVAAEGSFNNELGVPLTLLAIEPDTEVVVVEIGARGVGHIASLVGDVRPDVAIVTAVAGAHLEQFGDLDTVALAKGELVAGLDTGGVAVLNHDDGRVRAMAAQHPDPDRAGAVLTFSAAGSADADLVARDVELDGLARASFTAATPWGEARVTLPLAGRHHVGNALAALGAAGVLGVDPATAADGIGGATVSHWRSSVEDVGGVRVLNDAYNANPTSTLAALDALAALDVRGRRWAVLGLMAELGPDHGPGHARVGRHAAEVADVVLVVGEDASGIAAAARGAGAGDVREAGDVERAAEVLAEVAAGDAVLVKASRSAGLERVAEALTRRLGASGPAREGVGT